MKRAHEHGFDWVWLMDDDGRPAPDCLQILLEHGKASAVVAPVQREASGRQYGIGTWRGIYADATPALVEKGEAAEGRYLFAFVGPLIHRAVVDRVGLPRAEFFIWFDDYEYALRLHEHPEIAVIAVPRAQFFHELGGTSRTVRLLGRRAVRSDQPAWKTYYGTRNHLWTVLRTRRSARDLSWFLLHQAWLLAGDVVFEKDRRKRVQMRLRGIRDGALGRMGKRV
jgi:GT2 family glycosyltransferase